MIKDGVIYPSLEENVLLLNDFREDVLDGLLTMYLYGGGNIKGIVSTVDALPATGENLGDGYLVGADPYDLYIWATKDGSAASWVPLGKFPAKGEQGTRGDRGSIIINQTSDPKNAPDRSGDYWINTVTGDWFMSLKNTTASGGYYWSKRFNLKGKKGDRGPQGYQGVPGPVGPQGPVGPAGATYTPMDLDLNTGISAVTYNTTNGISLTTQGTIRANTGTNQVVVDYKIPIVAGNGISIAKKANENKIEVKVDSSRSITATGFVASENGMSVSLYSDNIQYQDYQGNQYMYTFPSKNGTLTTDGSFKTLFGKSIVGTGNINLYRHLLQCSNFNFDKQYYIAVYSSKSDAITTDYVLANKNCLVGAISIVIDPNAGTATFDRLIISANDGPPGYFIISSGTGTPADEILSINTDDLAAI